MKCYEYCKNNNENCKVEKCRYWIKNQSNSNCAITASASNKNMTLEDVGKIFNVTRMRICQIEKRAIEKLKNILMIT